MSEKKSEKIQDFDAMKEKIVLAAFSLAESQGWQHTNLRDIASEAEIALVDCYALFDDKNDILVHFNRMIDRQVLAGVADDSLASSRETLFDLMMDRYEALNAHRAGLVAILDSMKCDPKQVLISVPHLCRSMGWMLEVAGVDTSGVRGAIKVAGLSGLYLKVLKVWVDDDGADLPKTMSALDKALGKAEDWAGMFGL